MPPPATIARSTRAITFVCDSCLLRSRPQLRTRALSVSSATAATNGALRWKSDKKVLEGTGRTCPSSVFSRVRNGPGDTGALRGRLGEGNVSGLSLPMRGRCAFSSDGYKGLENSGLVPLPHRRLVSLSGLDAVKFLQGLVTNDVKSFAEDARSRQSSGFYSAFLDARGRVLWDVFVYSKHDDAISGKPWGCYIEVDAGEVEALIKHLKRHKLRSKISIDLVPEEELGVWAAWGLDDSDVSNLLPRNTPHLLDPRGENMGFRFLALDNNPPKEELQVPILPTQAYHLRRYLSGIPEGPLDIPRESALPMESNIDLYHGIDFKKGCYVGQELTIRTKHTGVVRKRVLPVRLYAASGNTRSDNPAEGKEDEEEKEFLPYDPEFPADFIPPNGAEIKQLDADGNVKKGRPVGKFIAGIGNAGIALVRLEMMTGMRVSAEGGTWKPGMRFGVLLKRGGEGEGEGKVVRVKAFAPQWLRERERDLWDRGRKRVFGEGTK